MPGKVSGDLPPRKGDIFQKKIVELISDLEYRELCRRRFGLDFVAEPPPEKIDMPKSGIPDKVFLRPLFSPKGKTAFEFKAGTKLQLGKIAEEVNERISEINADERNPVKDIAGGVIVTDLKVSPREIDRILEKYGVYLWDISTLCFLTSKVFTRKKWTKSRVVVLEERLDEWTTILRCTGTYPRSNCLKINIAMYYQNPLKQLELKRSEDVLVLLTQRIQEIVKEITLTTYVGLEIHSISGSTEELDENFHKVLEKQNQKLIIYVKEEALLSCYDIAPWHYFLSIIKR
jgi:hypothetical protein